ncbi:MAG: metallophosphoesterase [Myxococcales bacterium]|nr:metallophosphoesterase [Myxococcales bacterium]
MRFAHFSDLHLLADAGRTLSVLDHARRVMLSGGRPAPDARRVDNLRRSLAYAREAQADHVIITGDLTEEGTAAQFERLAEALSDSGWRPEAITLCPGNHDGYTDHRAWGRALDGVLRPWAETSRDGVALRFPGCTLVPVSTLRPLAVTRSAGAIAASTWRRLDARARECEARREPLLIAQHHPPFALTSATLQWFDGLEEVARAEALLARYSGCFVAHGHLHAGGDRRVAGRSHAQILGAEAAVRGGLRVRLYEAREGAMVRVG